MGKVDRVVLPSVGDRALWFSIGEKEMELLLLGTETRVIPLGEE